MLELQCVECVDGDRNRRNIGAGDFQSPLGSARNCGSPNNGNANAIECRCERPQCVHCILIELY